MRRNHPADKSGFIRNILPTSKASRPLPQPHPQTFVALSEFVSHRAISGIQTFSYRRINERDLAPIFSHLSFRNPEMAATPDFVKFAYSGDIPNARLMRMILEQGRIELWRGSIGYTIKENTDGTKCTYGTLRLQLGTGPQAPKGEPLRQYMADLRFTLAGYNATDPQAYVMQRAGNNVVTTITSVVADGSNNSRPSTSSSNRARNGITR